MKIKSSRNAEITLSFTVIGKSCPSRHFLASQICILMLSVKIKLSRKFPDLQYDVVYFTYRKVVSIDKVLVLISFLLEFHSGLINCKIITSSCLYQYLICCDLQIN